EPPVRLRVGLLASDRGKQSFQSVMRGHAVAAHQVATDLAVLVHDQLDGPRDWLVGTRADEPLPLPDEGPQRRGHSLAGAPEDLDDQVGAVFQAVDVSLAALPECWRPRSPRPQADELTRRPCTGSLCPGGHARTAARSVRSSPVRLATPSLSM